MSNSDTQTLLRGTETSDALMGSLGSDLMVGLAGDDLIQSGNADDVIYGDFVTPNLLSGTDGFVSFAQYAETGAWNVSNDGAGYATMSQMVMTDADAVYSVDFELAANYASGAANSSLEVLWNGVSLGEFSANGANFMEQSISFTGTGAMGEITFRALEDADSDGPIVHTDAPIFYVDRTVEIGGTEVGIKAFAQGQSNIYQVMNGTLHVFDPKDGSYTKAGSNATVTVNAIGYNVEDDLIYGLAVRTGVDSLGNAVDLGDLMMLDAGGDSYRVGDTPYRSWTGDFDQNGNLWAFQSSMDFITMIDVDTINADGSIATQTFKYPADMVRDQLWDVAYDASTNAFYGVTRPKDAGESSVLYRIDISAVAQGGEPVFSTTEITGTLIDGVMQAGVPSITFGGAIHDGDGNLYVAGNSGDHDMNDATGSSGGIYRVHNDAMTGTATLELVADAPRAGSNDGAADPRAMDPFTEIDTSSAVLLRKISLETEVGGATSYDDQISAGRGADVAQGGIGDDQIEGQAGNDALVGGTGDDVLYGGHAPGYGSGGTRVITYDADGNRFDANGKLLAEDNDTLDGGDGADQMYGGSGHDTLDGGDGQDMLNGGSGFDFLIGGAGNDTLSGGSEKDVLYGGTGDDKLSGGTGADQLSGEVGNDSMSGGSGDDTLEGGSGNDKLDAGTGNDMLDGGQGDDVLIGGSGNDVLRDDQGDNSFEGGSGNDHMTGGTGIDNMSGGSGDDVLIGGGARDVLKGGTGNDTLDGGADKDKLYGGSGDDLIDGGSGSDYINASHGDDVVYAGAGRDKVLLGKGADVAWGGDDTDWFVFRSEDQDGSSDWVMDYTHDGTENDRLDFRLMDLLEPGQLRSDWVAEHLSQSADHTVTVAVDNYTLFLLDHAGHGADFFDLVADGLQL